MNRARETSAVPGLLLVMFLSISLLAHAGVSSGVAAGSAETLERLILEYVEGQRATDGRDPIFNFEISFTGVAS